MHRIQQATKQLNVSTGTAYMRKMKQEDIITGAKNDCPYALKKLNILDEVAEA